MKTIINGSMYKKVSKLQPLLNLIFSYLILLSAFYAVKEGLKNH